MELNEWQKAGRFFRYGQHRVFYREEGRGEALLLLHGFPTASWDWHKLWEPLSEQFHLIAPDFIGFGFSDKPRPYPYSIRDQADMVENLLECKSIGHYHIFAHDYGDTVAQELLARSLEGSLRGELRALCLLNGGLFPEAHYPRLVQKLLISPIGPLMSPFLSKRTLARNFRQIFGPETQPSTSDIDAFWALIAHKNGTRVMPLLIRYMAERKANRARWVGALEQARIPVRLIDGAADPISGRRLAAHYQQLIPNPDVVLLDKVGHYPQTEAPDMVLAHFMEFMRSAFGG